MKVVLIGRGKWGKKHLPHLEKRFDVVGVFGKSYQIGDEVDAVVVATPIGTHYPIVCGALEKGKHVFCEKPLTIEPDKAKELIELSRSQGVQLVTDYTYTFSKRLKQVQECSKFGQPRGMTLVLSRNLAGKKVNTYWALVSHLLSILSMFTDLEQLGFTIVEDSSKTVRICFEGGVDGIIIANTQAERAMHIRLKSADQWLRFDNLADDDNIGHALDYFEDVMDGRVSNWNNLGRAYAVTKIIHDLRAR